MAHSLTDCPDYPGVRPLTIAIALLVDQSAGWVAAHEGADLGGAHVVVRADSTGCGGNDSPMVTLRTSRDGRFTARFEEGYYDLCVMANAFTPTCRKIQVKDGKRVEARFRLSTAVDAILNEGDSFPRRTPRK